MQSFCEQVDEDDLAIPSHHSPLKPSGDCSFKKEKKKKISDNFGGRERQRRGRDGGGCV